ncbi:M55 family metallopeptidase [Thalassobacillus pellis]|uniref:M55 family metallopeptidase n=1 Tax=Thalassobacillus pellis TaxID=748008 RepID=UPI001961E168|nr:M55 family metallopeptidase [Thalassobacillus pellis]MBM7552797.1 D-amino peptidase [Thalassobacillus pellis]
MKLFISVDMEGITGLPDHTYVESSKHNYERARRIMTEETNHVIEAALENGCTEVLVNDSHSKMNNILIDCLHPDAVLITGGVKPMSMVQHLDGSYAGAVFLGYHARAGQPGVMSHSMSFGVRNFFINDKPVGELGFNAYVAGYYRVPVLMVAGDDCAAREAEQLLPSVTTAAVKETISRSSVKSLTPAASGRLLRNKVREAMSRAGSAEPLIPPERPVLRIEFTNFGQAEWANLIPGTELEEGTTIVTYKAKNIIDAYRAMIVMTELASRTSFC